LPQALSVAEANTDYAEKPLTSAMRGETGKISAGEPVSRTPIDGPPKLLIEVADI
jgi:hypothetical protein